MTRSPHPPTSRTAPWITVAPYFEHNLAGLLSGSGVLRFESADKNVLLSSTKAEVDIAAITRRSGYTKYEK
jgi:hypothetical protein